MRLLNVFYMVCAGLLGSLLAATAWLGVWFGWKWGAHYAGVWFRGIKERLEAGDTSINQAGWLVRDRWETLGSVMGGPKVRAEELPELLAVIGGAAVVLLVLRVPGVVLAGWLGRRAIRRDAILCTPELARTLGRRVYLDGVWRWGVPAGMAAGAALALVNHLWEFGGFMTERRARILGTGITVLAFPVVDMLCSLRWARHLIAKDIRGRQRLCRWCAFDLVGVAPGKCPECGNEFDENSRDVGVRVVARPAGARRLGVAAVVAALLAGAIGISTGEMMGVQVWKGIGRTVDALLLRKRGDTLRVMLPQRCVVELERRGTRLRVFVTDAEGTGDTRMAVARMLVWSPRGGGAPVRLVVPVAGQAGSVVLGPMEWVKERVTAIRLKGAIPAAPTYPRWLLVPADVGEARIVEVGGRDADEAWLTGPATAEELKGLLEER